MAKIQQKRRDDVKGREKDRYAMHNAYVSNMQHT